MGPSPQLSSRESEVVQQLLEGKSNKMIAASLGLSERTVEFHLKNIYTKLDVRSRTEAILKLGRSAEAARGETTGDPGISTVAGKGEDADNRDLLRLPKWAASLRAAFSKIGEELKMENSVNATVGGEARAMTFFEAVRVCLVKYAEFTGRASRSEFWWFALFVVLVASALEYIHTDAATVFLIAVLLPFLAAGTRRLRDSGESVWWQFFLLVPVGGIILLGFKWAQPPAEPAASPRP